MPTFPKITYWVSLIKPQAEGSKKNKQSVIKSKRCNLLRKKMTQNVIRGRMHIDFPKKKTRHGDRIVKSKIGLDVFPRRRHHEVFLWKIDVCGPLDGKMLLAFSCFVQ